MPKKVTKQKKSVKNRSNTKKSKKTDEKPTGRAIGYANLTPGGPGRPKGKLNFDTRVDMAIEVLAQAYVKAHNEKKENKNKQITVKDIDIEGDIFAQFIQKARGGDLKAIDSFLDRRHGKATSRIELTGKDGDPIKMEHDVKVAREKIKRWQSNWFKKDKQDGNKGTNK